MAALLPLLALSFPAVQALRLSSSHVAVTGALRSSIEYLQRYTFKDFQADFNRTYQEGTWDYANRERLFNERRKLMIKFNSDSERSWKMGITKFLDYTQTERGIILGYKGRGSRTEQYMAPAEMVELRGRSTNLPSFFNVEGDATLLGIIRDQGNCGSCWAEAATSVLEGHLARNTTLMQILMNSRGKEASKVPEVPTLSTQMVVSCTPNERHCGGKGGCSGATAELAYEMIQGKNGLPFAVEWNYESGSTGSTMKCRNELFNRPKVAITGYDVLPSNKLVPLKEAIVQTGAPIAVSVDATNWFEYGGGIFSDTDLLSFLPKKQKGDFTVNHAVTLMGYKEPEPNSKGFWLIKNSWGDFWGESGKIRLEMKRNEEEHCGWDYATHDGTACDGDPDQAWVCGTCGVLYDSTFPKGLHLVP